MSGQLTIKTYLQLNDGKKLLNKDVSASTYYNQHAEKLSPSDRFKLARLIKMQRDEPDQYSLSVKALLD